MIFLIASIILLILVVVAVFLTFRLISLNKPEDDLKEAKKKEKTNARLLALSKQLGCDSSQVQEVLYNTGISLDDLEDIVRKIGDVDLSESDFQFKRVVVDSPKSLALYSSVRQSIKKAFKSEVIHNTQYEILKRLIIMAQIEQQQNEFQKNNILNKPDSEV